MKKIQFDEYATRYNQELHRNLSRFGKEVNYYSEYKAKIVESKAVSSPRRILEYGCGIGRNLQYLSDCFPQAQIRGCDISEISLEVARRENPQLEFFLLPNGVSDQLPFDLIFIANVFHHITPRLRLKCMQEVAYLLKSSGEVFIFEHNPYNPITKHLVNTCPFDADAILLRAQETIELLNKSGFDIRSLRYILFFPAFLRKLNKLEVFLSKLPLGGQYYIHAIKA